MKERQRPSRLAAYRRAERHRPGVSVCSGGQCKYQSQPSARYENDRGETKRRCQVLHYVQEECCHASDSASNTARTKRLPLPVPQLLEVLPAIPVPPKTGEHAPDFCCSKADRVALCGRATGRLSSCFSPLLRFFVCGAAGYAMAFDRIPVLARCRDVQSHEACIGSKLTRPLRRRLRRRG
jgi:hypothetical protein